jgi:hypothetical protein
MTSQNLDDLMTPYLLEIFDDMSGLNRFNIAVSTGEIR